MDLTDLIPYTKFLHIAAMFTAATLAVGGDLYFLRVAGDGSAVATARLGHAIRRRGPLTGPIMEIGVAFGLATALLGGFNLLAPWLVAAYLVVITMTVLAFKVAAPAFTTVLEAADSGDDAAVAAAMRTTDYRRIAIIDGALFGVAIFLMVVKPFA